MTSTVQVNLPDLTSCDREPIQYLGRIQSFGFLIALSSDWLITRVSANLHDMIGLEPEAMLGLPITELFTPHAIHSIRNRMTLLRGDDGSERLFNIDLRGDDRCFDVAVSMTDGVILIEAEPSIDAGGVDTGSLIRASLARVKTADTLPALAREVARQVRAMTGFDRVMVYRFLPDNAGEVIAEAVRPGLESYLGLRYPATDIPAQARALYLRNWLRLIADVDDVTVPIIPEIDPHGRPLDLSSSVLRAVSPVHIEYLKHMPVAASMSISLVVGGRLWGLVACHNNSPRRPSFEQRTAAELFGQMVSLLIESREREAEAAIEHAARVAGDRLTALAGSPGWSLDNGDTLIELFGEIVPSDGIAVLIDGRRTLSGSTPPSDRLADLVSFLNRSAASRIYSTDRLATAFPAAGDYAERVAGLLAIPISRRPRDYVILFRREQLHSVNWAGDPNKPTAEEAGGVRLSPRKSFAQWTETVRGRSHPFTAAELRAADIIRSTLLEVVLRFSDIAEEERKRGDERQELLIAELNHRVRNILALIRGLITQTGASVSSAEAFAEVLGGRVQALARAHDQITADNWGPASFDTLIFNEAEAYLGHQRDRVQTNGPSVMLAPQAYSATALVLHELMTNSAKYGALSDGGQVNIDWQLDTGGDLLIDWRESGGPAVEPPKRRGFGTTIIERTIPHDLGGEAEVRFKLSGLEARFRVPAAHVTQGASPQQRAQKIDAAAQAIAFSGPALLVEDSMLIALDAEDMLLRMGAPSVLTASNVDDALLVIDKRGSEIAVAVLDVNLGRTTSIAVAERLAAANIPFVFATGYGEQAMLRDTHPNTPVVQKPYRTEALAAAIGEAIGG